MDLERELTRRSTRLMELADRRDIAMHRAMAEYRQVVEAICLERVRHTLALIKPIPVNGRDMEDYPE